MGGGKGKIRPEDNPKPFTKDNQPKNAGRKPSIKKQVQQLILNEGRITIPKKQIVDIKENGDVVIKLPTQEAIAMKYISWAMSSKNKGADMLVKLQEMIDGKATQPIEATLNLDAPIQNLKLD